jgi:hypothetical protein
MDRLSRFIKLLRYICTVHWEIKFFSVPRVVQNVSRCSNISCWYLDSSHHSLRVACFTVHLPLKPWYVQCFLSVLISFLYRCCWNVRFSGLKQGTRSNEEVDGPKRRSVTLNPFPVKRSFIYYYALRSQVQLERTLPKKRKQIGLKTKEINWLIGKISLCLWKINHSSTQECFKSSLYFLRDFIAS